MSDEHNHGQQSAGTSSPTRDRADITELQSIIETIDALSQDGFSEIFTLAEMALDLMETERAYLCPETIAQVLTTIKTKASDIESLINSEAEQVGCNYKDEAAERRYEARCRADATRRR